MTGGEPDGSPFFTSKKKEKLKMNEINISEDRLSESTFLTSPLLDIALHKIGAITYAITEKNCGMRFAFSSAELTKFLTSREELKINDVKLLKQTPVIAYEEDETLILRLKLNDGTVMILNKYDHIYLYEPVVLEKGESILTSAHKQWGLPADSFAGLMLLTRRMINTIEDIADETQHGYLISVLWKEYRLAVESSRADECDRLCIEGEFMAFSVKRFVGGLFVFDHV
jgi:hypothetical protein